MMRMPGKKDPEYFPLNLNVNLYEFESSYSCHPPSYDPLEREEVDGMSTDDDDECRTVADVLRSRTGSNANSLRPRRRVRNVSLNMSQNSDDEGEGDSLQSSSDLDLDGDNEEGDGEDERDSAELEVDMMDTLVLSIREKLRMDPKFSSSSLWNDECEETTPPPTPYDPTTPSSTHSQSSHSHHLLRRRRLQPYPNSKTRNPLLSVQKKGSGPKHYWGGGRRGGRTNSDSPYELLQELLSSGSLIKEAVRRLSTPNQRIPSPQPPITIRHSPPSRFTSSSLKPTGEEESNLPLSAK